MFLGEIIAVWFLLVAFVGEVFSRETCGYVLFVKRYCNDGYECCGTDNMRCCLKNTLSAGAIGGIVIGCIVGVCVLVGICICICCAKCNGHAGTTVVQPPAQVTTLLAGPGYGYPGNVPTYQGPMATYPAPPMAMASYPPPVIAPSGQQNQP